MKSVTFGEMQNEVQHEPLNTVYLMVYKRIEDIEESGAVEAPGLVDTGGSSSDVLVLGAESVAVISSSQAIEATVVVEEETEEEREERELMAAIAMSQGAPPPSAPAAEAVVVPSSSSEVEAPTPTMRPLVPASELQFELSAADEARLARAVFRATNSAVCVGNFSYLTGDSSVARWSSQHWRDAVAMKARAELERGLRSEEET